MNVLRLLPDWVLGRFSAIIREFLWNQGRTKIAHVKLFNDRHTGGLHLLNLKAKDLALKCQWVSYVKTSNKLQTLSESFLPPIKQKIWICNLKPEDVLSLMESCFWRDVLYAWCVAHWHSPSNPSQIAAQVLWYNSFIKINNLVVFYDVALQAGVLCVYNIWNVISRRFLTFQEFTTIYGPCLSFLQYYGLVSAIPKPWVAQLRNAYYVLEDHVYPFETISDKISLHIYNKLTHNPDSLSALMAKWKDKLQIDFVKEEFFEHFSRIYVLVPDIKCRNFQFRYLHRTVFCADILYKWKLVDSPRCLYCHNELETMEHLFYSCAEVSRFWEMFVSWYEATTDTEIFISLENVSFCNHEIDIVNTLIIMAKQFLFSRRIAERPPNIYLFRDKVKMVIKLERDFALKKRRYKPFVKKWKNLFPCIDF